MNKQRETLSVTQAAHLCGVGRTTVGYWIRSKKLRASRTGKKYQIPVQDLLYFLKAEGQEIPMQLEKQNLNQPVFRTLQYCWRHFQDQPHGLNCRQCIVFKNRLQVCFSARNSGKLSCLGDCETCRYYQDSYYPRLQFIHQFDTAAAVVKDLYVWAANLEMARLCEVNPMGLVGMGVEQIVHPRSLECVISGARKKAMGDPDIPTEGSVYIKNKQLERLKVKLSVYLLKEPQCSFLVLVAPQSNGRTRI